MREISEIEIVIGIKQRNKAAFESLYASYYPVVERFILKNSGTRQDAEDIFQDTSIILINKLQDKDFQLTASLKTYLFAISSNLWLKKLRKRKNDFDLFFDAQEDIDIHNALSNLIEVEQNEAIKDKISKWLGKITQHCQHFIASIFFMNKKAEELGYKNKHTAQNQQYKCLQQIRKVVLEDNTLVK